MPKVMGHDPDLRHLRATAGGPTLAGVQHGTARGSRGKAGGQEEAGVAKTTIGHRVFMGLAFTGALGALALGAHAAIAAAETAGRQERLAAAFDGLARDLAALRSSEQERTRDVGRLLRRIDALSSAVPVARVAAPGAAVPEAGAPERPAPEDGPGDDDAGTDDSEDLRALGERVLAGEASADEMERWWTALRGSEELAGVIGRLEAAVSARPDDLDARRRLARAYVAQLYSVPDGPSRGVWAARAEAQWDAVLARDAGDWDARFSVAFSLSQWPEFFGKGPTVLRHLETLREQQESHAPLPREAAVYRMLADQYRRTGRADAVREVLEAGARRHPQDAALRDALAELQQ